MDLGLIVLAVAQNLQQSRGFGNSFRFPEGEASGSGGMSSNPGFSADETQEEDLYA